ncbi:hypothetical protein BJY01DRAFT_246842 [Aspergillus pseudoustus]|uniref:Uncharacterized protein n=1 Tax=Aspergillus pseudoustus TaxID=1810923 RepID=A0ABR4K595_9EURO
MPAKRTAQKFSRDRRETVEDSKHHHHHHHQPPSQTAKPADEWTETWAVTMRRTRKTMKMLKNESNEPKKAKCDGGRTCLCNKPATEHPEHPYTISISGRRKFLDMLVHTEVRTPDVFDMYILNDFEGLRCPQDSTESCSRLLEAKDNWKEQWAVLEGSDVDAITGLIARMSLTMLAKFESTSLLKPDSDVKNLHVVMALYLMLASEMREYNSLPSDDSAKVEGHFDAYVLAYAKKYQIKLQVPSDLDKLVRDIDEEFDKEDIKLPAPSADSWKWVALIKLY